MGVRASRAFVVNFPLVTNRAAVGTPVYGMRSASSSNGPAAQSRSVLASDSTKLKTTSGRTVSRSALVRARSRVQDRVSTVCPSSCKRRTHRFDLIQHVQIGWRVVQRDVIVQDQDLHGRRHSLTGRRHDVANQVRVGHAHGRGDHGQVGMESGACPPRDSLP